MTGIIRIAKDTFFGGAAKKAGEALEKSAERSQEIVSQGVEAAKGEIRPLFARAGQAGQQGFQAGLDIFRQTLPQQAQAFQGGNVAAQQSLLAGLQPFQQAILGGQIDLSGLQPFQSQPVDFSFAQQQQLPQLQNLPPQQTQQAQPNPLTGIGPDFFNNRFNRF